MKTLAGIGAASQFSGLFRDVWAQTADPPRFVVLSSPNGYPPTYWRPRAADGVGAAQPTGWTLDFPNSSLAPLQKHKDSLVIIEGLDLTTDTQNPDFYTGGHNASSILTGIHPMGGEGTAGQYKASERRLTSTREAVEHDRVPVHPHRLRRQLEHDRFVPRRRQRHRRRIQPQKSLANWFAEVGTGATNPKAAAERTRRPRSSTTWAPTPGACAGASRAPRRPSWTPTSTRSAASRRGSAPRHRSRARSRRRRPTRVAGALPATSTSP